MHIESWLEQISIFRILLLTTIVMAGYLLFRGYLHFSLGLLSTKIFLGFLSPCKNIKETKPVRSHIFKTIAISDSENSYSKGFPKASKKKPVWFPIRPDMRIFGLFPTFSATKWNGLQRLRKAKRNLYDSQKGQSGQTISVPLLRLLIWSEIPWEKSSMSSIFNIGFFWNDFQYDLQ